MFFRDGIRLICFAVVVIAATTAGLGQTTEAPGVIVVQEIKIKPTHVGQFEDALKNLAEAHKQLKTGASWQVSVSQSGEAFVYVFVSTYQNWAALDEVVRRGTPPEILMKAFGESEGRKIAAQALESFVSMNRTYLLPRPDLMLQ